MMASTGTWKVADSKLWDYAAIGKKGGEIGKLKYYQHWKFMMYSDRGVIL